jgi:hypothetical protein
MDLIISYKSILVVDVHHKPRGLTSLSRCHLSQVHKVQHKPRKKFSWEHKPIWSKGLESVLLVAHRIVSDVHRTLSGAPGPRPSEQATLGFLLGALHYNSPDCPVCTKYVQWASGATTTARQQSTAKVNIDEQCTTEVRAAKWEVTRYVQCGIGLSGATAPTVKSLQTPMVVLTWRAPDSERYLFGALPDCPLCPSPAKPANG